MKYREKVSSQIFSHSKREIQTQRRMVAGDCEGAGEERKFLRERTQHLKERHMQHALEEGLNGNHVESTFTRSHVASPGLTHANQRVKVILNNQR